MMSPAFLTALTLVPILGSAPRVRPGVPSVAEPVRVEWHGPPAGAGLAVPAATRARDRWIGEDKARHFLMSFALTALGYGAASVVGVYGEAAVRAGAAGSAVAGIGKEVHDRRAGGPFSVRDLVWDAAGIGAGVAFVLNIR